MAQSQNQRLRRMAEKAARRKAAIAQKRRAEAPMSGGSDVIRIIEAADAGELACLVTDNLFDLGIGWVVAARHLPSGAVGASFFLVDVWCLGIKDAFFRVLPERKFEEHVNTMAGEFRLVPINPDDARKLLQDAAEYAASFGLMPSENFTNTELIFGDTPLGEETFTFGKDGKSFYMSGPHDSPTRKRRIMDSLQRHAGPGDFDYLVDVRALG